MHTKEAAVRGCEAWSQFAMVVRFQYNLNRIQVWMGLEGRQR